MRGANPTIRALCPFLAGWLAALLVLLAGGAVAAQGMATVNLAHNPKLGAILVDAQGMTLYHLTTDTSATSTCTGGCAQVWPPLVASGAPTLGAGLGGGLAVITRPDGSKQVSYDGMPLYLYAGDSKPGDTNGQGIRQGLQGVWFAVQAVTAATGTAPTAGKAAAPTAPSTAPPTSGVGRLPKTGSDPLEVVFGLALVGAGGLILAGRRGRGRRR